ncbi:MAG: methyl-accepting chemotaxis protein [Desulfurivibrionaceae bacterium]|jgi:methyl-accepting chemotaxis protein
MKDFINNMKMFKKLLSAFMLVALICAVVGGVGYYGIKELTKNLEEVGAVRLPSVEGLTVMQDGLTNIKAAARTLLAARMISPEQRVEQLASIKKYWELYQKGYDIYAPLPQTAEEAVLWKKYLAAEERWRKESEKFHAAFARYMAGDVEGMNLAIEIGLGSERKASKEMFAALQEVLALNIKLGDEAVVAGKAAAVSSARQAMVAVVVGVLLAALFGVILAKGIEGPLNQGMEMLKELSMGHLEQRLRMERKDEIGQMAKAMDDFADNLQNNFVVALEKIADGNFAFDAHQIDAKDAIGAALAKTLEDMNATLSQIYLAGEQVNSAAAQVSAASQSLSQGATESASSLEEITSSMTEMGSQTKLNAGNATQANQLANQAKEVAQNGNLQMKEMVGAMSDISDSAQSISKIIKVIDEIAFQTNLLALNAAVEAARAGRHGKGFAVVAEEVRNLAARSAKAAGETAELIEGSVRKTEKGTQIADRTAEALGEIVTSVGKVTDLVGEIAAASNEQAQGISQVNEGLGQIDQVTQQNTASAEECAAAAEELSSQAGQLRQMLARFKLKMASERQQFAPMQPQQQMAANRPQLDYGGWGGGGQGGGAAKVKPSSVIALDDKEFGRY